MKKKYNFKKLGLAIAVGLSTFFGLAQNVRVSLGNVNNTFDGTNHFYEADVFIETIDGLTETLIGSGQLYFNYNTAAFGENINNTAGAFEATTPYNSGEYFLGQSIPGFVVTNFYSFVTNNNTSSRISWAFLQGVSSGAMTEKVTTTPRKLVHIKFRYTDENEPSNITIVASNTELSQAQDQFFTPCGPFDAATTTLDCTDTVDARNLAQQFVGATIDTSNNTDTMIPVISLTGDNPQEINLNDLYVELGATSNDGLTVSINDSEVNTGVAGDYNVYYDLTDLSGNVALQVIRIVRVVESPVLSIGNFENEHIQILIYPNPVKAFFVLSGVSEIGIKSLSLSNLKGKQLLTISNYNGEAINIEGIASGIYLLKIETINGNKTVKLIKE